MQSNNLSQAQNLVDQYLTLLNKRNKLEEEFLNLKEKNSLFIMIKMKC